MVNRVGHTHLNLAWQFSQVHLGTDQHHYYNYQHKCKYIHDNLQTLFVL